MTLKVNETFYSLQGEGGRAGEPSMFVRLTGCDLTCGFCDTEFESGKEMELQEIHRIIRGNTLCKWIVFTGGEPLLQLTDEILDWFVQKGYKIAIETNGNHKVGPKMGALINWLVVSPKVANHVVEKNFKEVLVHEYRLVRHKGHTDVSAPDIQIHQKFVSPVFNGNSPNMENVNHCIELCLQNPEWRLSLQSHKLLNVL